VTDVPALKRTPLFDLHRRLGARMVPFAGYEMPVQYSGIIAEHRHARSHAVLFDVSHMGQTPPRRSSAWWWATSTGSPPVACVIR
jgi:aminomethyltransferase